MFFFISPCIGPNQKCSVSDSLQSSSEEKVPYIWENYSFNANNANVFLRRSLEKRFYIEL